LLTRVLIINKHLNKGSIACLLYLLLQIKRITLLTPVSWRPMQYGSIAVQTKPESRASSRHKYRSRVGAVAAAASGDWQLPCCEAVKAMEAAWWRNNCDKFPVVAKIRNSSIRKMRDTCKVR
jgi:hypothetical protein